MLPSKHRQDASKTQDVSIPALFFWPNNNQVVSQEIEEQKQFDASPHDKWVSIGGKEYTLSDLPALKTLFESFNNIEDENYVENENDRIKKQAECMEKVCELLRLDVPEDRQNPIEAPRGFKKYLGFLKNICVYFFANFACVYGAVSVFVSMDQFLLFIWHAIPTPLLVAACTVFSIASVCVFYAFDVFQLYKKFGVISQKSASAIYDADEKAIDKTKKIMQFLNTLDYSEVVGRYKGLADLSNCFVNTVEKRNPKYTEPYKWTKPEKYIFHGVTLICITPTAAGSFFGFNALLAKIGGVKGIAIFAAFLGLNPLLLLTLAPLAFTVATFGIEYVVKKIQRKFSPHTDHSHPSETQGVGKRFGKRFLTCFFVLAALKLSILLPVMLPVLLTVSICSAGLFFISKRKNTDNPKAEQYTKVGEKHKAFAEYKNGDYETIRMERNQLHQLEEKNNLAHYQMDQLGKDNSFYRESNTQLIKTILESHLKTRPSKESLPSSILPADLPEDDLHPAVIQNALSENKLVFLPTPTPLPPRCKEECEESERCKWNVPSSIVG